MPKLFDNGPNIFVSTSQSKEDRKRYLNAYIRSEADRGTSGPVTCNHKVMI